MTIPQYELHGKLLRMKAKQYQLEQQYKRKSLLEKLYLQGKSYCELTYLYYFNRPKYEAFMKLQSLCNKLKQTDLH